MTTEARLEAAIEPDESTVSLDVATRIVDTEPSRCPLMVLLAASVSAVSLGIVWRAIDELVELAKTKVPAFEAMPLARSPRVRGQVAEAEALVRSSRASLFETTVGEQAGKLYLGVATDSPLF